MLGTSFQTGQEKIRPLKPLSFKGLLVVRGGLEPATSGLWAAVSLAFAALQRFSGIFRLKTGKSRRLGTLRSTAIFSNLGQNLGQGQNTPCPAGFLYVLDASGMPFFFSRFFFIPSISHFFCFNSVMSADFLTSSSAWIYSSSMRSAANSPVFVSCVFFSSC